MKKITIPKAGETIYWRWLNSGSKALNKSYVKEVINNKILILTPDIYTFNVTYVEYNDIYISLIK